MAGLHRPAQGAASSPPSPQHEVHVYAISDLHCDHALNMEWLRARMTHGRARFPRLSVLMVAGDVSDNIPTLREVFSLLKGVFWQVIYTPGNHELWVKGTPELRDEGGMVVEDSLAKLAAIRRLCQQLDVRMDPVRLGRLVLLPLLSWHHQSFDEEPDVPGNLVPRASTLTISDYARCVWPAHASTPLGAVEVAELLDAMNNDAHAVTLLEAIQQARHQDQHSPNQAHGDNQQHATSPNQANGADQQHNSHAHGRNGSGNGGMQPANTASTGLGGSSQAAAAGNGAAGAGASGSGRPLDVISMSHFLPSQSLLPEKRMLMFPNLSKAVGSLPLRARLRRVRPAMHVFGHTHFAWDAVPPDLPGVRCVQAPLCYPGERKKRMRSIHMQSDWQPVDPGTAPEDVEWLPLLIAKAHFTLEPIAPATGSIQDAAARDQQGLEQHLNQPTATDQQGSDHHPNEPTFGRFEDGRAWQHPVATGSQELNQQAAGPQPTGQHTFMQAPHSLQGVQTHQVPDLLPPQGTNSPCPAGVAGHQPGSSLPQGQDTHDAMLELEAHLPCLILQALCPDLPVQPPLESMVGQGGPGSSAAGSSAASNAAGSGGSTAASSGVFNSSMAGHVRHAAGRQAGSEQAGPGPSGLQGPGTQLAVSNWQLTMCPELDAMWSSYYKTHPRTPEDVQLAPWVAPRYARARARQAPPPPAMTAESTEVIQPLTSMDEPPTAYGPGA